MDLLITLIIIPSHLINDSLLARGNHVHVSNVISSSREGRPFFSAGGGGGNFITTVSFQILHNSEGENSNNFRDGLCKYSVASGVADRH